MNVEQQGAERLSEEEKANYLTEHGWSQWYHPNYWVHRKTVADPTRQDFTYYGMSLREAYDYEIKGGQPFK